MQFQHHTGQVIVKLFRGTEKEKPELYRKASPIFYVSKDDPPLLLVHGEEDDLIPFDQSIRMADAYRPGRPAGRVHCREKRRTRFRACRGCPYLTLSRNHPSKDNRFLQALPGLCSHDANRTLRLQSLPLSVFLTNTNRHFDRSCSQFHRERRSGESGSPPASLVG
jgi:hypothetical protein